MSLQRRMVEFRRRMGGELHVMTTTGPRACGKSTLLLALEKVMDCPQKVVRAETSEILDWHRDHDTPIGAELTELQSLREGGGYIPDHLVLEAIMEWVEFMKISVNHTMTCLLLGGYPRTKPQVDLLRCFREARVVHIQCPRHEVAEGVIIREGSGIRREDSSAAALDNNWRCYVEQTLPALKLLNGEALHLRRNDPFDENVRKAIMHLPVRDSFKERFLRRLKDQRHPAVQVVKEVSRIQTSLATA